MVRPPPRTLLVVLVVLVFAGGCSRARTGDEPVGRPAGELRFIFAETAAGTTTFWSASPAEPGDRRRLASVRHDPEWGVRAALSPDGDRLAYLAMPPGGRDPDRDAVLSLLHFEGRTSRRLATGLDLRTPPVWFGERGPVVQRRTPAGTGALVLVEPKGERALVTAAPGHRLVPIISPPDGDEFFVIDLSQDGSRLRSVSVDADARDRALIAEGVARGFTVSIDGRRLAFLRLETTGEAARYRAWTLDLTTGALFPIRPDADRDEDTGIVPMSDDFAVSAVTSHGAILLATSPEGDASRGEGFDALVGVSPDGAWLVTRSFRDGDPQRPGVERLELIDRDGRRIPIVAEGGVTALGWTRS